MTRIAGSPWLNWLPRGRHLSEDQWERRHLVITRILMANAAGIPLIALGVGGTPAQALTYAMALAVLGVMAQVRSLHVAVRACIAATGLMTASSFLVQACSGLIEAHFLFFVMVPIVAMYESWLPFLVAIGFVLFEHGIVGSLLRGSVYGTHDHSSAWLWAGIHAVFFAAACLGAMANWRFSERARLEQDRLAQELSYQADHDALTGLPNLSALMRAESFDGPGGNAVLVVNLDRFAQVNDALGHDRGDILLLKVAERIRAVLRAEDTLVRLGADDFAAIVSSSPEALDAILRRVQEVFEDPFLVAGIEVEVDASIGVAADPEADVADLLRWAESAMRKAKERRSGLHVFQAGEAVSKLQELNLFSELRRAIQERQLVLYYQPKIDLGSGAVVGAEALVRWKHPERGLVPPGDFLPMAESASLFRPLTTLVLDLAILAGKELADVGYPVTIAVNVSPRSLLDDGFAAHVLAALAEHDLDPALLRLEVTETSVMEDLDLAVKILRELHAAGIGISIDDFGTGYSSMASLRSLPVDELKVDQSFIRRLDEGSVDDAAIVEATIQLGHILNLCVVAEGIETERTMAALAAMGCDQGQGYHIARPMPHDQFVAHVLQRPVQRISQPAH